LVASSWWLAVGSCLRVAGTRHCKRAPPGAPSRLTGAPLTFTCRSPALTVPCRDLRSLKSFTSPPPEPTCLSPAFTSAPPRFIRAPPRLTTRRNRLPVRGWHLPARRRDLPVRRNDFPCQVLRLAAADFTYRSKECAYLCAATTYRVVETTYHARFCTYEPVIPFTSRTYAPTSPPRRLPLR